MSTRKLQTLTALTVAALTLGAIACGSSKTNNDNGGAQTPAPKAHPRSGLPGATPTTGAQAVNPPAPTATAPTLALARGWQTWRKLNLKRFNSKSHRKLWVDTYANAIGFPAFWNAIDDMSGTFAYPAGTIFVKAMYAAQGDATPTALVVMEKRAKGYDPDNGDWFYARLDPDLTVMRHRDGYWQQGKLMDCQSCHENDATDYVFGVADDENLNDADAPEGAPEGAPDDGGE